MNAHDYTPNLPPFYGTSLRAAWLKRQKAKTQRRSEIKDRRIEDPSNPPPKYRGGKVVGRINRRWVMGGYGRRDYDYPDRQWEHRNA